MRDKLIGNIVIILLWVLTVHALWPVLHPEEMPAIHYVPAPPFSFYGKGAYMFLMELRGLEHQELAAQKLKSFYALDCVGPYTASFGGVPVQCLLMPDTSVPGTLTIETPSSVAGQCLAYGQELQSSPCASTPEPKQKQDWSNWQ